MADVVLLNPGVNFAKNLGLAARFAVKVPPLGLAYMGAILKQSGYEVVVIDQFAGGYTDETVVEKIVAVSPKVIGINMLTASANKVRGLCLSLRQMMPEVKLVLGNIHAAIFAKSIIGEGWADVVVAGEGEYVMKSLTDAFMKGNEIDGIPGVTYLKEGEVRSTPPGRQLTELDELPFPAWELFDLEPYKTHTILTYGKMTLPLISSRGCPWRCSFCSQNHFWSRVVVRRASEVVRELEYVHRNFGCEHFTFHDANFPVSKKYGIEFSREAAKVNLRDKITFVTEARLEVFDEELILALKNSGCRALMFGIESGSEKVRAGIHKTFTNDEIHRVVAFCHKHKIHTMGLFLVGLPGETRDDIMKTMELARSLPLDLAKFNIVVPYPGSKIFEDLASSGLIGAKDFDRIATYYSDGADALTVNENLSTAELDRLQKSALLKFYTRPKVVLNLAFGDLLSSMDIAVGACALLGSATSKVIRR